MLPIHPTDRPLMRWLWILVASTALSQTTPQTAAPLSASEAMKSAMEKQRAAARIQAQSTGARLIPWSPALEGGTAASAACDPIAESAATPLIESAAKANSIEPNLLRAVIDQESGFRPCAVSSKGAQGLMQLMPDTASTLGVKDTFDPKQNVEAGARYLKQLHQALSAL